VFQLDDLEIRFHDRQVRVGQRTTNLTPKELDLLHYFVTHPNSTLTHKKILQAVWGADYGSHVEYLRVFVNQLRKKIEIDPTRPRYILTEPWLGYRFNIQGTTKSTPTGQE
jgi:two-component system KDP operon response regulator KdpE